MSENATLEINGQKYEVNNIDITVICEKPKLNEYIGEMISKISDTLDVHEKDINIKATTNEGLGTVGSGKAIASLAIATIIPTTDYGVKENK